MADIATTFPQPAFADVMNSVLPDESSRIEEAPDPGAPVQIDSEHAEAFISEKRIGERIKHLRLKKTMGLVELGRHTGLSASFLSQLETGRVVPTLRNLARIAMVFSKDLSYFFEPEPAKLFRVHRSKDRVRLPQTGVDEPSYFFESLGTFTPDRALDPYFAEFLPQKAGRESKVHQHAGNEFLFLTSGELDVRHGEETYHITEGDGIYFDAGTTHGYMCVGDKPATAVIVIMAAPIGEGHRGVTRMSPTAMARMRSLRPNGAAPATATRPGQTRAS